MKLYPQDLRDRQHAAIIRRRAYGVYGGATPSAYACLVADPPAPRPVGRLGRAVDSLPLNVSPPQNTDELRRQAAELLAHAQQEKDSVVSASLERQADALSRRAMAGARSALVMQRARALRQEVLAQIEALRAGLSDFSTECAGTLNAELLATLSEDARRVADAAESAAQARLELDTYLTVPESAVMRAGRG